MRVVLASLLVSALAFAQGGNPADTGGTRPTEEKKPEEHLRTYEMPGITVVGERATLLREEDRIGTYGQPRWSADRRFTETRVYVIPEGKFELEWWTRIEVPKDGPTELTFIQEAEIGLPYRFQLDLYTVEKKAGNQGSLDWDEVKIETRWALADWDEIPMNPTLYLEYVGPNKESTRVEAKLLLGTELAERWHYGANIVWDHATGDDRDTSWEVNQGISYTLADEKVSLGVETNFEIHDDKDHRWEALEQDYLIGPSVQVRPLPQMHIDFSPLFGINDEAPDAKITLIFGWEF